MCQTSGWNINYQSHIYPDLGCNSWLTYLGSSQSNNIFCVYLYQDSCATWTNDKLTFHYETSGSYISWKKERTNQASARWTKSYTIAIVHLLTGLNTVMMAGTGRKEKIQMTWMEYKSLGLDGWLKNSTAYVQRAPLQSPELL